MTIRSQPFFSAYSMIASQGCMPSIVSPWQVTPAASQASITARTWRAAERSWASKNSCGGVGCISATAP